MDSEDPRPRLVSDDLVELSSGARIKNETVKILSRSFSYRYIAEAFGVSYLELQDAVSLLRSGSLYQNGGAQA